MENKEFDSLALAKDLEAAGVPNGQAEAIAAGVRDARSGLATKADLDALEVRLDAKLDAFEARLDAKLAELRAGLFRALWVQGAGLVAIILAAKLF